MNELLLALALVLVIEGALYALFPDGMKRMMVLVLDQPSAWLRNAGLVIATLGVGLAWLVRG
ncbi:MAG: DUF2065 domain-containing protein [Alphaproteobacteria bacterium]|jgi:hypothetical protein|nr:hypothetical protein [Rhodospirillaceae bacterium]MDP6404222.1 DUF2065 domain-containing protein [Alphaproteobacteria bacterium]MDP6622650.1 DUF2065 domain-containing protein [Alphaproteobacteria bacterium]HJP22299.1 DUF2065 domain-containing protein [Alphaproteobacteria bacterium]|tara:strand:- start:705 stop:890 length:186 start_codon:yes stop_codon:yes gene_type:complete